MSDPPPLVSFRRVYPRGERISRHIRPPRWGRYAREIGLAVKALDRTLADGELRAVTTRVAEPDFLAATNCRPIADYDPLSRQIRVSPASMRPATDWLHEVGHVLYLDYVVPAKERAGIVLLQGFQAACEDSRTTGWLREIAVKMTSDPQVQSLVEYSLSLEEQFVRSFAQFVAVRSGAAQLEAEIHRWSLDGGRDVPVFWTPQDFVRIDAELVVLFHRLGWIRT